ncbi:MAG: hypothetical protein SW019_16510 [Actinomycetota bacterium]|nr:hypothetical protein [Actinomycetota bacterium]
MRRPADPADPGGPAPRRPAAGYAAFIGRVGALAVFLGVGSALALPATAHAESEGSSSDASAESSTESSRAESRTPRSSTTGGETGRVATSADTSGENDDDPADADSLDDESLLDDADSGTDADSLDDALDPANGDTDDVAEDTADLLAESADDSPAVAEPDVTSTQIDAAAVATFAPSEPDDQPAPVTAPADWPLLAYTRRQPGTEAAPLSTATQDAAIAETAVSNQVSPLGTPEQIARERIAMQTARSLPVALMKIALRFGFLSAAERQFALVGGPDAANRAALDEAIDEYALAASFQQQILNPMDPAVVTQVAPPHSWYGIDVGGSRLLYDNPDTIYRFVPVNKIADYVLTGRIYEGIPADTTFSVLEGTSGTTSTILSLQDLDVSDDGTFVITISGDPAAPGQTNHLQLTSSSTLVAARNTLGDWNVEDPMELAVHRVGGPPNSLFAQLGGFVLLGSVVNDNPALASVLSLIPPLGIAESRPVRGILTALLLVVRGSEQAKYMALATTDTETGELRSPNVMTQPASNAEFLANQLQSNGYFQLADDEALVLTIDPGNAGFFTVPVYNDWTITDDYWNQQTSLNDDQSLANPDGTYTMVVSIADPGVANWISTGGLNQGIISMRFQNLDPDSPELPTVGSVLVKLEDLDEHLPAGTVYYTPAQRAAQLAERKAGYDRRWAPYPQA